MRKKRTVHLTAGILYAPVYTAPARFEADVKSIIVANVGTSAATFDIKYYEKLTDTTHFIVKGVTISRGQMIQITDPLFLLVNDKLIVSASTADTVKFTVTVNEEPAYTI